MRLICACDTAGHDVSCYAVIDLAPELAKELLAIRPAWEAAHAVNDKVYVISLWDFGVPDYFWEGLPHGLSEEQTEALEEVVASDVWVPMPEGWEFNEEPRAHTDVEQIDVREESVCFTAFVGDLPVETAPLDWLQLDEVARGANPWALAQAETAS